MYKEMNMFIILILTIEKKEHNKEDNVDDISINNNNYKERKKDEEKEKNNNDKQKTDKNTHYKAIKERNYNNHIQDVKNGLILTTENKRKNHIKNNVMIDPEEYVAYNK